MPKTQKSKDKGLEYTAEIHGILERACQGDESALPELRALLDDRPDLWRHFGEMGRQVEELLIKVIDGRNLLGQESHTRQLAALKKELAGPNPSALEKLLVERIGICWLQVHHGETEAMLHKDDATQRRLQQAHHRYLGSIKQLALVRRLVQPVLPPLDELRSPEPEPVRTGPTRRRRGSKRRAGLRIVG